MSKVTACLITWRRQKNLAKIIDHLSSREYISEIIIRDNSRCENILNWGRYTSAMKAENNIIYTQDDDCIVHNIDEIYESFCADPFNVCHGGTVGYQEDIENNLYGVNQMAMFGWGAFFDRRWVPCLNKYIEKYGMDYTFYRETDRIFTLLLNRRHNFVLSSIEHLEGADDEHALCQKDDHLHYKREAIERALKL